MGASTAFLEQLADPALRARVTSAFVGLIQGSFETHPMRHVTQDEVRRRFGILERWYRVLRGDRGWSVARVLDTLPRALLAELNGQRFEPEARASWLGGR